MAILQLAKKYKFVIAIIVLVMLALFYLGKDAKRFSLDFLYSTEKPIGSYLSCAKSPLFEKQLLNARKSSTAPIQLLIHFSEKPSQDVKDYFATAGVMLDINTWILDYAVADTTVNHLCFLADLPGITKISIAE